MLEITRRQLREVRKMWEVAEQESIRLHAQIISGGARLIYEDSPTPEDLYNTELEFCALANKIDRIKPPPYGALNWNNVSFLFGVVWRIGRDKRSKLKGTWPAWACSWLNFRHARCYAILALLAARPFLPFHVPERIVEPVLATISAA